MSPVNKKVERAACYVRVSHQEQKLHGLSLDAQRDTLKRYAEKHGLIIVEWYEDEGISGRKLIRRRPALQRMIKDAQEGKFDRIIFIKLDRFFRSIAEYHECMKMIDPVIWTATEEKYDLSTANGRAFVNMKLTIAELEADQTGERIDIVNEYKIRTGQALAGSHVQGLGHCVRKDDNGIKRVVKDPDTKEMCEDIIDYFLTYQSKADTLRHIYIKYGVTVTMQSLGNFLKNTKLYGYYRGNDSYCEPYINKATFDKIQDILSKNLKNTPSKNVYMFSGLIKCPCCGKRLNSTSNSKKNCRPSFGYRCSDWFLYKKCDFRKTVGEKKIEKALLTNLDQYVNAYIQTSKIEDKRIQDTGADHKIKELEGELSRLTKAYRKGRIKEAEYDKEYEYLEAQLKELQEHLEPILERDLTVYEGLLKSDWRGLYDALNSESKRAFWRKYVKNIVLNVDGTVNRVIFF